MQIQQIRVKVNSAGLERDAFIGIPDDKSNLVVLCMNHGLGECVNEQIRKTGAPHPESILIFGALEFAKQGHPMKFKNPNDQKDYNFLNIAIQDDNWSPDPQEWKFVLDNYIKTNFPGTVANFITGLSAGGDTTLKAVTTIGVLEKFSGAIPMSPASTGIGGAGYTALNNAGIKIWGFSGNVDGNYTENLKQVVTALNIIKPGTARQTIYSGGHCCWNGYYDPNYREVINGKSMNIYEFLLSTIKISIQPTPDPEPQPQPPSMTYTVTAGKDQNLPVGAIRTSLQANYLDGNNNPVFPPYRSYVWSQVSGDNSAVITNKFGNVTDLTNLKPGEYIIRCTFKNELLQPITDDVRITVAGTVTPPSEKKMTQENIFYNTDGTIKARFRFFDDNTVEKI